MGTKQKIQIGFFYWNRKKPYAIHYFILGYTYPLDAIYHSAIQLIIQDSYCSHHCEFYENVRFHRHLQGVTIPVFSFISLCYLSYRDKDVPESTR